MLTVGEESTSFEPSSVNKVNPLTLSLLIPPPLPPPSTLLPLFPSIPPPSSLHPPPSALLPSPRYWLEHFPEDFKAPQMVDCVSDLQTVMRENGEERMADYISLDYL